MLNVVQTDQVGQSSAVGVPAASLLDELAQAGVRRILAAALKARSDAAQGRWRVVNAPHLVALVRASARFASGGLVERSQDEQAGTPPVESAA